VRILKKSWYVPAATALRNSFFLFIKPRETIVLVIVVPTLAPIIIGIALCRVREPEATRATTTDVVVELLCNIAVINKPINRPVNGFEVANRIVSVTFFPMYCNDEVIRSRANRKRTNAPRMYRIIFTLSHVVVFGSII
jgi:hypothetical protein